MKNPKPYSPVNEFTHYKYGRRWKWIYTEWENAYRKENNNHGRKTYVKI